LVGQWWNNLEILKIRDKRLTIDLEKAKKFVGKNSRLKKVNLKGCTVRQNLK
jgi:hypothetical protein